LSVALSQVPPGVSCFQLTVASATREVQQIWQVAGLSQIQVLASELPTGPVVATGAAFSDPKGDCSAAVVSATPTWISDGVTTTLTADKEGSIALTLYPNGQASVTVDFNPDVNTVSTVAGGKLTNGNNLPGAGALVAPSAVTVQIIGPENPGDPAPYRAVITDSATNSLSLLDASTGTPKFSLLAGSATGAKGYQDGPLLAALFNNPAAECELRPIWNPPGSTMALAVADRGNCALRMVDVDMDSVTTLAGGSCSGKASDGDALTAGLLDPRAIVAATQGQHRVAYFIDGHAVRMYDADTKTVSTLAGNAYTAGAIDGTGGGMRFSSPGDLAWDGASTLYVADTGNHAIRAIDLTTLEGKTVAGKLGQPGDTDGSTFAALLNAPRGIIIDTTHALYIVEATAVRRMAGNTILTIDGSITQPGNSDGPGPSALFGSLGHPAVAGHLGIFIPDPGNASLRLISH
jgi:hypothetical protein